MSESSSRNRGTEPALVKLPLQPSLQPVLDDIPRPESNMRGGQVRGFVGDPKAEPGHLTEGDHPNFRRQRNADRLRLTSRVRILTAVPELTRTPEYTSPTTPF